MSEPPLVLIVLPFEAAPVVRIFAGTDRQEARLWEWFGAHPELAEIVRLACIVHAGWRREAA